MRISISTLLLTIFFSPPLHAKSSSLQIAYFEADASPPVGSPLFYEPTEEVLMRLSARGVVLLGAGEPIVLCAVDWIGIADAAHTEWRAALAQAAGTTSDRVAVHALHQHDAPGADFDAEAILAEHGLAGKQYDNHFIRKTIAGVAAAVRKSLREPQRVTHLATGVGEVKEIASNRRIIGKDGKLKIWRGSSTTDPVARAEPEGIIDPLVRSISFLRNGEPIVVLCYYATHPMSYYRTGKANPDFVGIARAAREQTLGVPHIYFTGAAGNIAAGKYNDGSPENRQIFADRLTAGMALAWQSHEIVAIAAVDVAWRHEEVVLPVATNLSELELLETVGNAEATMRARFQAAQCLAWYRRCQGGSKVALGCLHLGHARSLHICGELFVEYQLAAQQQLPEELVAVAAYGDYGPGYIGLKSSYPQGGFEVSPQVSLVAPEVEDVLMPAISRLVAD